MLHPRLSPQFAFSTDLAQFRIVQASDSPTSSSLFSGAQAKFDGSACELLLPASFQWQSPSMMRWLETTVRECLRTQAKRLIVPRLAAFAKTYGYQYRRVFVKDLSSRWGSCSENRNINLNLWLLLLPSEYVDYVLKHELAHLRELNHSPRFWQEVDKMTGGAGTARALAKAKNQYVQTHVAPMFY